MELGVQCTEEKVDSGDEIFNFIQNQFWKTDRNIKILQVRIYAPRKKLLILIKTNTQTNADKSTQRCFFNF